MTHDSKKNVLNNGLKSKIIKVHHEKLAIYLYHQN